MLDSYIKIDDIKKLLDETASINGLIKKSDFQKAISLLKEYKRPQPGKVGNRINKAREIIANIIKYQNSVATGEITSDIMKEALSGGGDKVHTVRYIKIYIDKRIGDAEKGRSAIGNTLKLASILGISVPTVHKWMKNNIIIRHIPHEVWYFICANKEFRGRLYVPYYYDLEEIKNNLKRYK